MSKAASTQAIDPVALVREAEGVRALIESIASSRRVTGQNAIGSAAAAIAVAALRDVERPMLLVCAHLDEADDLAAEIDWLGETPLVLPALEAVPGESTVAMDLFAERVILADELRRNADAPRLVIAPIHALMQPLPAADEISALVKRITPGDRLAPGALLDWLDRAGYRRTDTLEEPGDVAVRGGIGDVFSPTAAVRLDFFGDEIDQLSEIDLDTMGSDRKLDRVDLVSVREDQSAGTASLLDLLSNEWSVLLRETSEILGQAKGYYERVYDPASGVLEPRALMKRLEREFASVCELNHFGLGTSTADERIELGIEAVSMFPQEIGAAIDRLGELAGESRVLVLCRNAGEVRRAGELLAEHDIDAGSVELAVGELTTGYAITGDPRTIVVGYDELLHRSTTRRRTGRLRAGKATDAFLDFAPGDIVVHADHGIAKYVGLTLIERSALPGQREVKGRDPEEYLILEFAGRSRINVPAIQIDKVQRYIGGFRGKPQLSTVGGTRWQAQKDRVSESVRELAAELLRVRAARQAMPGTAYPRDTPWMGEFEAEFPYTETEDQLTAIEAVKRDMEAPRPMDRLLCGDVGFGKTEVAIRAAFKAVESGRQVAVLVPTTVLAEQHERTFDARFADYPFTVASLSRFKGTREIRETLADVAAGRVDIIIGTHRLLSNDVRFADLGLVVIDEEQRFGVEHKERLLTLRMTVDVLTMSATPIPRTLHMAMLGIRDISSLTTPPADRRAIVTEVVPYSERRIAQTIQRELAREGQVFYVHNRVHNIQTVADKVRGLAPGAKVIVGHGQMPGHELEEVMLAFIRGDADILVSTTIIESGIDIPTANTMIIADAQRFGLAELHQLRGRVGRHARRAYCSMMLPETDAISEVAKKRLKAIEEFSMLGAGFKIAMRDLEIRGAGNLLGPEQSGHIAAVGYDMYCRLLEQAVKELRSEPIKDPASNVAIELGITGVIPRPYIPSDARRLEAYRRLATAEAPGDVDRLEDDLKAAYGPVPRSLDRLLGLARVRTLAAGLGVRGIVRRDPDIVFRSRHPAELAERLQTGPGAVRVVGQPDKDGGQDVYLRPSGKALEAQSILPILLHRLAGSAG